MPTAPPVTAAAVIVRFPADEIRPSMPTPAAAVASIVPLALMFTACVPLPTTLIPVAPPETAAAEMVSIPATAPAAA